MNSLPKELKELRKELDVICSKPESKILEYLCKCSHYEKPRKAARCNYRINKNILEDYLTYFVGEPYGEIRNELHNTEKRPVPYLK